MKLYSVDLSPYAAKVRMQVYAKGLTDVTLEEPGPDWGLPAFRGKFPIGRIPVLEVDGDLIPESTVISEYLEEIHPEPSLLGATPRESAHIRALARLGDAYLIANTFTLSRLTGAMSRRTPAAASSDPVCEQLVVEIRRNLQSLEQLVGRDGYACCGRLTLADCALVVGLSRVEQILPLVGVEPPIPALPRVAAYWSAIRENEHAARVLAELQRGFEERRERIRDGWMDQYRAKAAAAWAEADSRAASG